ncbi:MAG: 3-methyl-2-oxobutanoate hydroxymethyltransferase [Alphaproteobacteria bacterium]|jgi:3-methyl-2-oxobutanoate hydroxymethyltransferase|nr:3-methyl-2-oxobutanoate hydroxymethyltransferase [Alphaproteobacteria bacterium]MDP7222805.1 3-methyl-2-oxobutanoate hydroxymethyltransferase [Alphaproteobacteria bacterium]
MNIRSFQKQKGRTPLVCLTAYSGYMAALIEPHVDLILVGDSLGMVQYGMSSTLSVPLDMMIWHGKAVAGAVSKDALVIVDMPFGSYQERPELAFRNAARIMAETGASGVKMEGGTEMAETVAFLTERGIPVMGHVGLKPQSVHAHGGYRTIGKDDAEKARIIADAAAIDEAGAFSLVLECVTADTARVVTESVQCPTIGIGASQHCDGQVLVTEDLLGITGGYVPSFVKQYADLAETVRNSVGAYAQDVKQGDFPQK